MRKGSRGARAADHGAIGALRVPAYNSTVATDGRKGDITFGGTKCFVAFYVVTLGGGKKTALISIGGLPVTVSTDKLHEWAVTDAAELQKLKERFYDNGQNRRYDPPHNEAEGHGQDGPPSSAKGDAVSAPEGRSEPVRPATNPSAMLPHTITQSGTQQVGTKDGTAVRAETAARQLRQQPQQQQEQPREQQQRQQTHGHQQQLQIGQNCQEQRQGTMGYEDESNEYEADVFSDLVPPLNTEQARSLEKFLDAYPEESRLGAGHLNAGPSTAGSSTPRGAAQWARPQMGQGGCGGSGTGEFDGVTQAKTRRKKKRDSPAAGVETDGGRKKPKCDGDVQSLLASMYEEKYEAMQAVLAQLKLGHAGNVDATPEPSCKAVVTAFRAAIRDHSTEIATMLLREGVVPSAAGIKHAILNSGAAITAIHRMFVAMGAPDATQQVYSVAIERLIMGNNEAAAKVVWDNIKRVQTEKAKRMAKVAAEVGQLLRERMATRAGVVAHSPTCAGTVNAYLTLITEMRGDDEMLHGAGAVPAWLRPQIFWVLVPSAGNRYGGPAAADVAQASERTTFAPSHAWLRILLSVQQAMDVPEISRALFWVIFSAASGACHLPQPETYLERMVLATSVQNKKPDGTEQVTRGMSSQLLGAHEGEWYSDDGVFSVPWTLIADQVPRRIAFFLRILQLCPDHDSCG